MFNVAREAERGELAPADGLTRLGRVRGMRNRYSAVGAIAGQVVVTLGIALLIRPSDPAILTYIGLGLLVALLRTAGARVRGLDPLMPMLAAGAVTVAALLVTGGEFDATTTQALVPPLVVLLPGALLTMATVDLASGEVITGASRFLEGLLQLALLAFGILAGAALVGITPAAEAVAAESVEWWVPWLGVLVFAVGIALQRSAPLSAMPWLLAVLYAAIAAELLGEALFGAGLSGFVGGMVAAPLALLLERIPKAPPAFVTSSRPSGCSCPVCSAWSG